VMRTTKTIGATQEIKRTENTEKMHNLRDVLCIQQRDEKCGKEHISWLFIFSKEQSRLQRWNGRNASKRENDFQVFWRMFMGYH
jgi:hypothetical protein